MVDRTIFTSIRSLDLQIKKSIDGYLNNRADRSPASDLQSLQLSLGSRNTGEREIASRSKYYPQSHSISVRSRFDPVLRAYLPEFTQ